MVGIPKFGKNWLDNFIPDEEMQNIFLTSEVVRNVLMLEAVYYASIYNDLFRYKMSLSVNTSQEKSKSQLELTTIEQQIPNFAKDVNAKT
eukprot:CAMPEP_0170553010 /NCGR_PEP_ID=MMETSP0211-20121228/10886_1 /TAXON_ID=311385 /ORGANISM="Pseudokeronopsis sp., Strain OXSARD2" /LENGTH=89 /DNA_ID=CAMNT_0010861113 /DNA_START=161 /DNA_END=430 /DNA_ORIENTATION=+